MSTRRNKQDRDFVHISIIVPAFRERANLAPLVERLCGAMGDAMTGVCEIIIVDDNSNDGSRKVVEGLAMTWPVRIIVRSEERGLSSAVLRGFREARG